VAKGVSVPILAATGLGRRLEAGWIWRGLDLTLSAGDRAVLTGRSGTGKSLLMRVLCGLDRADEGHVFYDGTPLDEQELPTFRARVMHVQQQPVLIPGTVLDNLDLPLRFHANAGRVVPEGRAAELVNRLGKSTEFLEQRASMLSGGEGQIVGLVRALLLEPRVLLLDEPTAHLDAEATRQIEEAVFEWVDAGDRAVLWTSHDRAQVDRVRRGPAIELLQAPGAAPGAAPAGAPADAPDGALDGAP
jgi:UDP-glucose/iron transport system ATP-binding protein